MSFGISITAAGVTAAAAAVGAGASVYGASQSGGSAPPPAPPNPAKYLGKYLDGLDKGLPRLAEMEGEYRPQFGQLNINDQQQYLNALLGLGGSTSTAAGQQIQQARQQDFGYMQQNTGSALGILGGINPAGLQQAQQATQLANDAYTRAQGPLSFQDARSADQTAREAFADRGRLNDNASIAAEVLSREDVKTARRGEAVALGQNAFGLNQQFSSPALSLLMGTPQSTALGQDYLANSAGIIGKNGPQFINPDAGINMGMQNAANLNSYNIANAAAQQNRSAMFGQVGGSLMDLAGTIYSNR